MVVAPVLRRRFLFGPFFPRAPRCCAHFAVAVDCRVDRTPRDAKTLHELGRFSGYHKTKPQPLSGFFLKKKPPCMAPAMPRTNWRAELRPVS